ncbi:hypothetical protein FQZ97_1145180 [compost metagenome]
MGKLSAGNTPTRLLTADSTRVNRPNSATIAQAALAGIATSRNSDAARIQKEPMRKPRRENFTVHQIPARAPSTSNALSIISVPMPSARPIFARIDGRKV